MTAARRLGLALVVVSMAASRVAAGELVAETNLVIGQKQLDSGDWRPVDDQPAVMLESSWGRRGWPVLIAADLGLSTDDASVEGVAFDGETFELALGARRFFGKSRFHPHLGAGAVFVTAEIEASGFGETDSDDDSAVGYWVGGGLGWEVGSRFNLGLVARYSGAEVNLAGIDGEAGGLLAGVMLGWRWAGRP